MPPGYEITFQPDFIIILNGKVVCLGLEVTIFEEFNFGRPNFLSLQLLKSLVFQDLSF